VKQLKYGIVLTNYAIPEGNAYVFCPKIHITMPVVAHFVKTFSEEHPYSKSGFFPNEMAFRQNWRQGALAWKHAKPE
jgi:hypothetical protein